MASVYPRWTAHSSPNEMYFYNYGVPTFTSGTPGALLRLKSLYCTQASGTTAPLRLVGSINEEVSGPNTVCERQDVQQISADICKSCEI